MLEEDRKRKELAQLEAEHKQQLLLKQREYVKEAQQKHAPKVDPRLRQEVFLVLIMCHSPLTGITD